MSVSVAVCLLLILPSPSGAAGEARNQPNILFILTDDQGWPTLGCYGGTKVATPHLDGLAAEGVRFSDAYVMPQCTQTRAALLTGQHTARNGMWHVIPWYGTPWAPVTEPAFVENLPRSAVTLPKALRAAGYATGMAGKWHLTANEDGHYTHLKAAAADAYGFDYVAPPGEGSQNEGDKWVDHLTDEAIGFARQHQDRPWFFYLSHHTLHGKVSAPDRLVAKHRTAGAPEEGLHNATYLAAIEHLDDSVGRLLEAIDELGLRERTVVVFLSDNGGVFEIYDSAAWSEGGDPRNDGLSVARREFSNAPLRAGKGSQYEAGIRVPCIVRWPGQARAGAVESTPVHVVDWFPTLLEAAGGDAPEGHVLDGASLVPLLQGDAIPERTLFWHLPLYDLRWGGVPCSIVRRGPWKLIRYYGGHFDDAGRYVDGPRLELFNLASDLGESSDLAPVEPTVASELNAELRGWLAGIPAPLPAPNPHHDPEREFLETREKPER